MSSGSAKSASSVSEYPSAYCYDEPCPCLDHEAPGAFYIEVDAPAAKPGGFILPFLECACTFGDSPAFSYVLTFDNPPPDEPSAYVLCIGRITVDDLRVSLGYFHPPDTLVETRTKVFADVVPPGMDCFFDNLELSGFGLSKARIYAL